MHELYHPNNLGKRVEVFLSLQRRYPRRWIVRSYNKSPSSTQRTVLNGENEAYDNELTTTVGLKNCTFYVYETKRKTCLKLRKNGKKDVFAWIVGDLVDPELVRTVCTREVTYHMSNPTFQYIDGTPVQESESAYFTCIADWFRVFVPE